MFPTVIALFLDMFGLKYDGLFYTNYHRLKNIIYVWVDGPFRIILFYRV